MIALRLASYGAAYFFVAGVGMSYWSVWLQSHGADAAQIGTLYMSRQIVTVAATLAIGWLAHRLARQRPLMHALLAAAVEKAAAASSCFRCVRRNAATSDKVYVRMQSAFWGVNDAARQ